MRTVTSAITSHRWPYLSILSAVLLEYGASGLSLLFTVVSTIDLLCLIGVTNER